MISCSDGEQCVEGLCIEDPCGAMSCEGELLCINGLCVEDPCLGVRCPGGERCEPDPDGRGQCVPQEEAVVPEFEGGDGGSGESEFGIFEGGTDGGLPPPGGGGEGDLLDPSLRDAGSPTGEAGGAGAVSGCAAAQGSGALPVPLALLILGLGLFTARRRMRDAALR